MRGGAVMKRSFLMVALFAGIGLAGCSAVTSGDGASDDRVQITYARGTDTTGATDVLVEAFEKEHPEIDVEVREMPSDTGESHNQYVTMFSGRSEEIDVFDADIVWSAEFGQANYVLPLDRLIERDQVDMDAYFPATVEAGRYNGRQYAMPGYADAGLLYYRTDITDQVPETWDELEQLAQENMGKEGSKFGYLMQAAQYEGIVTNAIEYIYSYGGQVLDANGNVVINSPEAIEGLQKMIDITNSDFVPNNILNFQEIDTESSFNEGNAVYARNWPYLNDTANDPEISKVAGNVGIATLPAGSEGAASSLGGWMRMINRYSDEVEASWTFVKWMSGEEGQKISALEGGKAPTLEALYDDKEITDVSTVLASEDFYDSLQNAIPRPITPIYPEISDIMQIELSRAMAGDITAEEAVERMETKMQAALESVTN
ncbi:ABC transporter substrate-binding protein [Terribacillus saccharophilus]|uniref:ABC transporter substrate-binding protein n=2 Tax=Terribacillus saccharophilus TaxID=361277 RepID=A0ABX4GZK7_9BACI|nr:ABC transporter substrate-binding protein [Terribacillus saccharophilus]PAD96739.1 ABC transporter substrate-binding protein [Terribacillus saccharophilus]PAE00315.1 ABC transporter substrate-binding protein [Terribacillus saccharophilus]